MYAQWMAFFCMENESKRAHKLSSLFAARATSQCDN